MAIKFSTDRKYIINNSEKLTYVHRDSKNFNQAIAKNYFQHKQQQYSVMLNQYREALLQNIHINGKTLDALNLTTKSQQDQLLKNIDSELTKTIEQYIKENSETLSSMRQTVQNLTITNQNELLKFLETIEQAVSLLHGENNALSILLNQARNNGLSLGQLSAKLVQKFNLQNKNGQLISTSRSALDQLAAQLARLTTAAQGIDFSQRAFNGYLNAIFGTRLGEYAVAKGVKYAFNITDQIVEDFLSGTSSATLKTTLRKKEKETKTVSKPDVVLGNGQVRLTTSEKENVTIVNLGLSVKQYSGTNKTVDVVSGKPFQGVLEQIFPNGKYYVYNTLGLLDDTAQTYTEMKKAILFNQAPNFLAGFGASNYAQYIVVNGKLYSIYEILKQIKDSKGNSANKMTDDIVAISIAGAKKIKDIRYRYGDNNSLEQAWLRNKDIHREIGNLTVKGSFNFSNFQFS